MCITFFSLSPFSTHTQQITNILNQPQKYNTNAILRKKIKSKPIHKTKSYGASLSDKQDGDSNQDQAQRANNQQQIDNSPKESDIKFIIAFNRDQQSYRQTQKLGPFQQDKNMYAGKDKKSGGTWLGVNIHTSIMTVLTNYDLPVFRPGKSRGKLVKSFITTQFLSQQQLENPLKGNAKIKQKLIQVLKQTAAKQYAAFNLLVYNIRSGTMFYICSEINLSEPILLQKGKAYGLCNNDIFNNWPKTQHGLAIYKKILAECENKNNQEIMSTLLSKLMQDKKRFSPNLDHEAAIFLDPFYSTLQNAERMTKSTFFAIIREKKDGEKTSLQLDMRQITHKDPTFGNKSKRYSTRSAPKLDVPCEIEGKEGEKSEKYEHIKQSVIDFKFIL